MAKHIPIKLLIALMAGALLAAFPSLPAFAPTEFGPTPTETRQVNITVIVGSILWVEYTGNHDIVFVITKEDLKEGSMMLVNQGDLNWCASVAPWDIMVQRTEWETENGDPDLELWLEVHYGPPPPPPPPPPDFIQVTTTPTVWIHGTETGSGTFVGVDWKIKKLSMNMQPGTYTCTVTITIVSIWTGGP